MLLRFWHWPVLALGPGRRLGLWMQGCSIHCAGCIAPENQPFDEMFSTDIDELMRGFAPILGEADGVTISGGEPTDQPESLTELLRRFNDAGVRDILLYSGRTADDIRLRCPGISENIAALVDGPFIDGMMSDSPWKGSDNQTLTLFREEFGERYAEWSCREKRNFQLVRKDSGRYLIGIPHQADLPEWSARFKTGE